MTKTHRILIAAAAAVAALGSAPIAGAQTPHQQRAPQAQAPGLRATATSNELHGTIEIWGRKTQIVSGTLTKSDADWWSHKGTIQGKLKASDGRSVDVSLNYVLEAPRYGDQVTFTGGSVGDTGVQVNDRATARADAWDHNHVTELRSGASVRNVIFDLKSN